MNFDRWNIKFFAERFTDEEWCEFCLFFGENLEKFVENGIHLFLAKSEDRRHRDLLLETYWSASTCEKKMLNEAIVVACSIWLEVGTLLSGEVLFNLDVVDDLEDKQLLETILERMSQVEVYDNTQALTLLERGKCVDSIIYLTRNEKIAEKVISFIEKNPQTIWRLGQKTGQKLLIHLGKFSKKFLVKNLDQIEDHCLREMLLHVWSQGKEKFVTIK